jgi:hypothetical protein
MASLKPASRPNTRRKALGAAVVAAFSAACGQAFAFDIDVGNDDVRLRFDNTIRYNLGVRTEGQDPSLLGNLNADDGDRNFKKNGIVNNRVDLLSELDLVYKKVYGGRISASGWYDNAYSGGLDNTSVATSNHLVNGAPALGLSDYTKRYYRGPSGELLDAFVFGTFDLGSMPLGVRAGRHNVNWGESLLSAGAIHGVTYAQSPLDQAKAFASPGIEAKELYRPLTQVSASLQATPELALAAQYYLDWEASRLPESGSYLGLNDALQRGGESLYLAPGVRAVHGTDLTPDKRGDWGLAARWSPDWLEGTAGLYYRNFSDKLPQVILLATAPRQYFLNYGGDIDLYGLSLARQFAGVSVGLDVDYRRNMPLVSDTVAVTSLAALPAAGETLGARGNTLHVVLNALGSITSTPLFDSASWAAELTWSRATKVTQNPGVYRGRDSYTAIDKVSHDGALGIAVNFTPTWFQVFPGADLLLPLSYSIGLSGNSPVASGGNIDAGSYAAGIALDLNSRYRFDLKYVDYFGSTVTNAAGAVTVARGSTAFLTDRGGVFFTFKTTF